MLWEKGGEGNFGVNFNGSHRTPAFPKETDESNKANLTRLTL